MNTDYKICVIGLGYVGLPLAVEFAKKFDVVGYDTNSERVAELHRYYDRTDEISEQELNAFSGRFTSELMDISECTVFIVTVPTPIDQNMRPDLSVLKSASSAVSKVLKKGDLVIYESTVYPGVTEDVCVPLLESLSGLKYLQDFNVGYSPERINPGDKVNTVKNIRKLVSADSPDSLAVVKQLYDEIIVAGTFSCESIKVAECCKCFENTQRDMNIALMNTLSGLCNEIGIATNDVIDAGLTKWNFLDFRPGLVGGHCISVDPYYMVHLGHSVGVDVSLIESSRKVNEGVTTSIYNKTTELLGDQKLNILICGYTFKEDCPDIRNTKVEDLTNMYSQGGHAATIYDPIADCDFVEKNIADIDGKFDLIIFAVKHSCFVEERDAILELGNEQSFVFDLKSQFAKEYSDWRL
jgi:UDP-N-acetyl-D-glucosamine/UDP-N-acetyl-D-galactosamine dehydrogenase